MIPRFLNKEEIDYAKMFKNNDPHKATCFNYQTDNKKFNAMLTKAIKRGTPVTLEELSMSISVVKRIMTGLLSLPESIMGAMDTNHRFEPK